MKQIIMLALVLTTLATTAFSNNTDAVNQRVLNSFSKTFSLAENVNWEVKKDLYKATFKINGQVMFAYYDAKGSEIAVSRNITISQLPLALANELRSGFQRQWLTDLFEISANGQTTYYATVHSSTHITTYKAEGANEWMVYHKEKK